MILAIVLSILILIVCVPLMIVAMLDRQFPAAGAFFYLGFWGVSSIWFMYLILHFVAKFW